MTNKEIKFKDLSNNFQMWVAIFFLFVIGLIVYLAIYSSNIESIKGIKQEISNMPHKYCYNETYFTYKLNISENKYYPIEPIKLNVSCDCNPYIYNYDFYIPKIKEVCEIK